jgi:hypothetical protein
MLSGWRTTIHFWCDAPAALNNLWGSHGCSIIVLNNFSNDLIFEHQKKNRRRGRRREQNQNKNKNKKLFKKLIKRRTKTKDLDNNPMHEIVVWKQNKAVHMEIKQLGTTAEMLSLQFHYWIN